MPLAHDRRGSGPPLVLIHGIGSQWQMWQPVLDRLAREREVVALDLPGFGDSAELPARRPSRRWPARWRVPGRDRAAGRARRGQLAGRRRRARAGAAGRRALGLRALPRRLREHARGALRARRARRTRAASRSASTPRAELMLRRPGAAHARLRPPRRAAVAHPARRGRGRHAQPRPLAGLRRDAGGARRPPLRRPHADCPVTVAWGEKDRLLLVLAPERPRAAAAARRAPRDARRLRPRPDVGRPGAGRARAARGSASQ